VTYQEALEQAPLDNRGCRWVMGDTVGRRAWVAVIQPQSDKIHLGLSGTHLSEERDFGLDQMEVLKTMNWRALSEEEIDGLWTRSFYGTE
jgi:hypothetical protein